MISWNIAGWQSSFAEEKKSRAGRGGKTSIAHASWTIVLLLTGHFERVQLASWDNS